MRKENSNPPEILYINMEECIPRTKTYTTTVEYKQFLACLLFNLSTGPGRLARSRLREQERSNQNTERGDNMYNS
jgi:hypothetical protein